VPDHECFYQKPRASRGFLDKTTGVLKLKCRIRANLRALLLMPRLSSPLWFDLQRRTQSPKTSGGENADQGSISALS
jgi:hypothetical protein